MDSSQFQKATQYAIDLLQNSLLPAFTYHSLNHTLDVANTCKRLAELEELDPKKVPLLVAAAYFHDTGLTNISSVDLQSFNDGRAIHEEKAVQIARQVLPGYGFTAEEVDTISRLIMSTKWGHKPADLLEQIISDADMSSLGREPDTFIRSSQALRDELETFGFDIQDRQWYQDQKDLVEKYVYHTHSARNLFEINRSRNLAAIQSQLDELGPEQTPAGPDSSEHPSNFP